MNTPSAGKKTYNKEHEEFLIVFADTVIDPRTMMIEPINTAIADT